MPDLAHKPKNGGDLYAQWTEPVQTICMYVLCACGGGGGLICEVCGVCV